MISMRSRHLRSAADVRPFGRRGFRHHTPAAVELLEQRTLLTAYVVDTLADTVAGDGKVSLREAVQASNANVGIFEAAAGQGGGAVDSITFAASLAGGTITLNGTQLGILDNLTITGLGVSRLTISGDDRSRVFLVGNPQTTVAIGGLTITGGRASGNDADGYGNGGGIWNLGSLTLRDCVVRNNRAVSEFNGSGTVGGDGGGIYNIGTMLIVGCTIANNSAETGLSSRTTAGGGIVTSGESSLRIERSTISGNSARYGGGIDNRGITIVSNSTISGNSARSYGGGVYKLGGLTLRNVTVFGNRADADGDGGERGGGIYHGSGPLELHNTLIAGNVRGAGAGTPDDVTHNNGAVAGSHSLIGDAATADGLVNGVSGNVIGIDWRTVLDPVLRNNGGPTLTHALLPGGAAVNAGNTALARDVLGNPLETDQRGPGFPRAVRGRADIGAFEVQPVAADLVGYLNGNWWVGVSDGTKFTTTRWAAWADENWDVLGQADFTGDGRADLFGLLDGEWWVGASTGAAFQTGLWGRWRDLDWRDVKAADLNGDDRADILARVGGEWWAALSTGTGLAAPKLWTGWADLGWREFFTADLNGDERADLLGFAHGQWWAGLSTGSGFAAPQRFAVWSDSPWQKLVVLDADGDGKQDVAGLLGGNWWVGRSDGTKFATALWWGWADVAWSDPVSGDFDGDGRGDVAARNGGHWWVSRSTGGAFAAPVLWASWTDAAWKDVRVGDFDADGRDDITGRLNGQWWTARSTGGNFATTLWEVWVEGNWRGVGAVDATGPPAVAGSGSGGAFSAAADAPGQSELMRKADDEPLALFWNKADEDEEFATLLAAG